MMTDSTWATVKQSHTVTDVCIRGLLAVIEDAGRVRPAQRRLLRLIWKDRAWIRPSLVRQVAALRRRRSPQ